MKAIKYIFASAVIALASCNNAAKTDTAAEGEAEEPATEVQADSTAAVTVEAGEDAVVALASGTNELPKADVPVLVDFSATWCGPCQRFKPVFHKVAEEFKGKAIFMSVDVDECPEIAKAFDVQSIPFIIAVMPDGSKAEGLIGDQPYDDFKAYVEKAVNK